MFEEVMIPIQGAQLAGHLSRPKNPKAWVIFAHGSGSSRKSSRNNWVADELNKQGYATFLFDLLTPEEDLDYENRFNIPLLAQRLKFVSIWLKESSFYEGGPIAYFGASTGAGAALMAAAETEDDLLLYAVISRGGRPDLAGPEQLKKVSVPVLLIVGSLDDVVIELNRETQRYLPHSELKLVPGATHLFEEPGTLAEVVKLSLNWLERFLPGKFEDSRAHREGA